jgi:Spaetzle
LEPCSYLTENFESSCTQVYNYHRLLSWDNTRGLHVDIFKVPTCCSCHLVGYKEAFPPLASPSNSINNVSKKKRPQDFDAFSSSSNRNSQYSTLNESDDFETNDGEDSNIAYQFGNGFRRLKPNRQPEQQENVNSNNNNNNNGNLRNRNPTKRNQFPESFLTPPANSPDSNFPFTNSPNRGPSNRQRTPTLKRKQFDQNLGESDLKISRVTVFPPKVFSQSERPRRVTPSIASTIDTSVNLRLPNAQSVDPKRVNYNYHPIIDFFEEEEPKKPAVERKTGKIKVEDSWRPVIGG